MGNFKKNWYGTYFRFAEIVIGLPFHYIKVVTVDKRQNKDLARSPNFSEVPQWFSCMDCPIGLQEQKYSYK